MISQQLHDFVKIIWERKRGKIKLDKEENEILESFERGEWTSVSNLKSEIKKHHAYARNTLKKDKRVNIRISSKDLEEIQAMAIEDGIPYQTLISRFFTIMFQVV